MVTGDLRLDPEVISGVGATLSSLADTLDSAKSDAKDVGDFVGDSDVAGKVRGVQSSWDNKRRAMLEVMRELAQDTADAFIEADRELAEAVTPETSPVLAAPSEAQNTDFQQVVPEFEGA